jgi:hypothetical protein
VRRSGASRESGRAAGVAVTVDRRRVRALRRSYTNRHGPAPCRSGASRESGRAAGVAVTVDRRRVRALRRSYANRHGPAPCRSGASRESGRAAGVAVTVDRRRVCARMYNGQGPARLFDLAPGGGYVALVACTRSPLVGLTHVTIVSVTVFLHRHQAHRALELHPLPSHFSASGCG